MQQRGACKGGRAGAPHASRRLWLSDVVVAREVRRRGIIVLWSQMNRSRCLELRCVHDNLVVREVGYLRLEVLHGETSHFFVVPLQSTFHAHTLLPLSAHNFGQKAKHPSVLLERAKLRRAHSNITP